TEGTKQRNGNSQAKYHAKCGASKTVKVQATMRPLVMYCASLDVCFRSIQIVIPPKTKIANTMNKLVGTLKPRARRTADKTKNCSPLSMPLSLEYPGRNPSTPREPTPR